MYPHYKAIGDGVLHKTSTERNLMKYWIQKTNGLITRSGFGEKPVEAEYETNIHKYSIKDCYLQGT